MGSNGGDHRRSRSEMPSIKKPKDSGGMGHYRSMSDMTASQSKKAPPMGSTLHAMHEDGEGLGDKANHSDAQNFDSMDPDEGMLAHERSRFTKEEVTSGKIWKMIDRDETDINLHNIGFTKLGQSSDHQALRNVVSLNVSQNKLKSLGANGVNLKNLKTKMSGTYSLSTTLPNLQEIDLGHNKISEFPSIITSFKRLRVLRLYHNSISSLPSSLYNLTSLEEINIFDNKIKNFPNNMKGNRITNLVNLRDLSLGANPIKKLPKLVGMKSTFKKLSAFGCNLESVVNLYELDGLEEVYLYNNKISAFPRFDPTQKHLHLIDISINNIDYIPVEIADIKGLTSLNVSRNLIETFPEEMEHLIHLQVLRFSGNKFTKFPSFIFDLPRIREVQCSGNKITTLSKKVEKCKKLATLQIAKNKMVDVPFSLMKIQNLKRLQLAGNPIDMTKENNKQVMSYMANKLGNLRFDMYDSASKTLGSKGIDPLSPRNIPKIAEKIKYPTMMMSSNQVLQVERKHKYMDILNEVDIFAKLFQEEKMSLAMALVEETFKKREVIISQGEEDGDKFYVIFRGSVTFHVNGPDLKLIKVGEAFPGQYFGEVSLMHNVPRAAWVKAGGKGTVLLSLRKKKFEKHCGPLRDLMERNMSKYDDLMKFQ